MPLTVKTFLQKSESGNEEIRRFSVPADVYVCYNYLAKKISTLFPSLRHGRIDLYWKDSEGDQVAFSTDEELREALDFVKDSLLKIYVREQAYDSLKDIEIEHHLGVICDGCNGDVFGNRYKCMECPDYDLCSKCEKMGIHKEHDMMRITTSMETPPLGGHDQELPFESNQPEHNGPFFIPHYFRRWMHKFMRRWFSRNDPGRSTENKTEDSEIQNEEKAKNLVTEEHEEVAANVDLDWLKRFQKSVDAMLNHINVEDTIYVNRTKGNIMYKTEHGRLARKDGLQATADMHSWKQVMENFELKDPSYSDLALLVSGVKVKDNGTNSMETESEKQLSSPMMTPEPGSTSSSQVNGIISRQTEVPSSNPPVETSSTSRSKDQ